MLHRQTRTGWFVLVFAILGIALLGTACVAPVPATRDGAATPTSKILATATGQSTRPETPTVAPTEPTEPEPSATAAPATDSPEPAELLTGIDAEGHFYRGDPNARVTLTEFSDFQ